MNLTDVLSRIETLQHSLERMPQVDLSVSSNNINGMYIREITIPANTSIVGRVHLYPYVDIMLSGDITIVSSDEPEPIRYTGHNVMFGVPGRKRTGFAHEETKWVTIHRSDIKDGDEFYEKLTAETISECYDMLTGKKDYLTILDEIGFAESDVQDEMNLARMTDFIEDENVYVAPSLIHGSGLFAKKDFMVGEIICTARKGDSKTIAGRYSNHSPMPNARMQEHRGDLLVISTQPIFYGEEITTNYRDTIRGHLCHRQ